MKLKSTKLSVIGQYLQLVCQLHCGYCRGLFLSYQFYQLHLSELGPNELLGTVSETQKLRCPFDIKRSSLTFNLIKG